MSSLLVSETPATTSQGSPPRRPTGRVGTGTIRAAMVPGAPQRRAALVGPENAANAVGTLSEAKGEGAQRGAIASYALSLLSSRLEL